MHTGRKFGTGVAVIGLVLSTAQAANATQQENATTTRPTANTITLITGDQVTMHDGQVSSVRPGPGREKMTFFRFISGGHTYVVPNDAQRLLATDQLDTGCSTSRRSSSSATTTRTATQCH